MSFHRRRLIAASSGGKTIKFKMWSAASGGTNTPSGWPAANDGAGGGYLEFEITADSGDQFVIMVPHGGNGQSTTGAVSYQAPGFRYGNGGSETGTDPFASGGGMAGVFVTSVSAANALGICGGAGAPGNGTGATGGPGGGTTGASGGSSGSITGGAGGTDSAGGSGGTGGGASSTPGAGSALQGGVYAANTYGGNGGGAGWYGGGTGDNDYGTGANQSGAGAGSSKTQSVGAYTPRSITHTQGSGTSPGNSADGDRISGVGVGGAKSATTTGGAPGGNGQITVYVNGVKHTDFTFTGANQTFTVP